MDISKLTLLQIQHLCANGELSSVDVINYCKGNIRKYNDQVGAYITLTDHEVGVVSKNSTLGRRSYLDGIPVSVKDVFSTQDVRTTAGSRVLENYIPPFSATAYTRLTESGAILTGKTNMDEFAHGFTTEYSAFFPTRNPWNLSKVPGGSSGGSAASVAAGMSLLSLASENLGSIVQPASLCGMVGFKPTYGRSSRYGIIAMVSSLECPGIIARCVEDAAVGVAVILGKDPLDTSSFESESDDFALGLSRDISESRVAVVRPFYDLVSRDIQRVIDSATDILKEAGASVDFIDWYDLSIDGKIYDTLYRAEVSSNLARYDGIRFGYHPESSNYEIDEYYLEARDRFGKHVKRQIVTDSVSLSDDESVYQSALKHRRKNREYIDNLLRKYDALVTPATAFTSLGIGEINDPVWREQNRNLGYINSAIMSPSVLYGYPSVSVPAGFVDGGMPIGIHLFSGRLQEQKLLNIAYAFQEVSGLKLLNPFDER